MQSSQSHNFLFQVVNYKFPPYPWSKSKFQPNSPVVKLDIVGKEGRSIAPSGQQAKAIDIHPIDYSIENNQVPILVNYSRAPEGFYRMIYHRFYVNNTHGYLHIGVQPNDTTKSLNLFIGAQYKPTPIKITLNYTVPNIENEYKIFWEAL